MDEGRGTKFNATEKFLVGFILFILAAISINALGSCNAEAAEPEYDRRAVVYTTGVTAGPWIGGNSWPHTGTAVTLPLLQYFHPLETPSMADFMDWHALQELYLEPEPLSETE